jgi:alkanesulfonate monooxygenase SsuD/methylene tetrahydromethanopterin reductase-like flavin-dependent oxidoreductase (luciferase family)
MKFMCFHLMPWPYLPDDFNDVEPSAWVTYSNMNYDPARGRDLYARYIDELCYAEEVGFDAICVNEHHQTAYGLMPSPNLVAGMLVQRTKRAEIAILGNAIPLRDHPLRVAEEVAMLDVISGGRIICGFVRGIGPEYHSFTMNPAESLERFREAHDLIIKAWTEPGPFRWCGKHYRLEYVNPWPRPLQQPHPPVWLPSQGSSETVGWAAERRYSFLMTFTKFANVVRAMEQYRNAARDLGYDPAPEQMGWSVPVYVGESDEQAMEEAAPHLEYLFNTLLKRPPSVFFPPGYLSENSAKGVVQAFGKLGLDPVTAQQLNADGQVIVGSPETVRNRLREAIDRSGVGVVVPLMQIGTMSAEMTRANLERFGQHVLEPLREYQSAVYA